jgi:predicted sulfurtransferase
MKIIKDVLNGHANKAVVAFVTAGIAFATEVVLSASSGITSVEWLHGGVGLAVALGIYTVANRDA